MKEKISVIIPAFNEEETIASVIKDIKKNMADSQYEYDITVVDDASEDRTAEVAQKEGAKVITHQKNKGYGAAIGTGIENSSGEFIATIDADGSHKAKDLAKLTEYLQESDMVVGVRAKSGLKESILRKTAKFFLTALASYLAETKIPDLNSGLRIMRRENLNEFRRILPKGYSFTTTATLAFLNSDLRVNFIPIDYHKRRGGRSRIRPIYDTLNFLQLIIKTIMYFNPLKVFLPLGLFLFIAGVGVLFYSYFFMEQVMDITTIVLVLASVQILAIGMVADLVIKRME